MTTPPPTPTPAPAAHAGRPPIRVLCVDDNQFVADATRRRLLLEPRFEWAGWLPSTEELVEHARRARPDVILLDIDMPGPDVFDLMGDLAAALPDARIVMFSAYVRGDLIDRAIACGAWGYISKNENTDDIIAAVDRVAAGEFALTGDGVIELRRTPPPA